MRVDNASRSPRVRTCQIASGHVWPALEEAVIRTVQKHQLRRDEIGMSPLEVSSFDRSSAVPPMVSSLRAARSSVSCPAVVRYVSSAMHMQYGYSMHLQLLCESGMHHSRLCRPRLDNVAPQSDATIRHHVRAPVHAAFASGVLTLDRCFPHRHAYICQASPSQQLVQHQQQLREREQRGLQVQLERAAARDFRQGNYDRITQTVREQVRRARLWQNYDARRHVRSAGHHVLHMRIAGQPL